MAKPLVTHVLWTLERGGAERLVFDLARRLPELGFDVEVLAAGGGGEMFDQYRSVGIRLYVNPNPGGRREAVSFLREQIKRRKPAIWHTHLTPVWAGIASRSSFIRPWIATAHGFETGLPLVARLARRAAYRSADHVVCVSEAVRASIRKQYGLSATKTSVIPPGIDPERFPPREPRLAGDVPELVTVSRLSEEKGLETLLHALSDILRPWRLTVVGDGPEATALKRLAQSLGILPRVRFVGSVADPSPYLRNADFFCLPSKNEGQGIALLEAAMSRVPAIASDLPAVREAFGAEGVQLVSTHDAAAWHAAIERALSRPAEGLSRAGRAESMVRLRYTIDQVASEHAELYRRFMKRV